MRTVPEPRPANWPESSITVKYKHGDIAGLDSYGDTLDSKENVTIE